MSFSLETFPTPVGADAGQALQAETEYILKALEAQEGETDTANLVNGGALQPQSMEQMLNHLTWGNEHLVLYNLLKQHIEQASSTVEEYSQRVGYGQADGYVAQMENPAEGDPAFVRKHAFLRFLRQQYKYSDVSTQVKTISKPEKEAKEAAIMRLMRTFTRTMYAGDSALIPEAFDGFEKTILNNGSSRHVVDLRAGIPSQQSFANLTEAIMTNYGNTQNLRLLGSPAGINQLGQIVTANAAAANSLQRWTYGVSDGGVVLGTHVSEINTQFGKIFPTPDLFIGDLYESNKPPKTAVPNNPAATQEGQTALRSPMMPSVSAAVDAPTVTGSLWLDADARPSGNTYKYRVAAGNRFGLSAATVAATPGADVLENGAITVTITPAPGDPNPPTYFVIYSEKAEGFGDVNPSENYRFIGRVANSGAATTTFQDLNARIPGTSVYFLLSLQSQGERRSFGLKQLGNIHSIPLAKNGPWEWGIVNYYMTPIFYQPLQYTMMVNVPTGDADTNPFFAL